ncbi:MAG: lipopolysaccharide heptosyltransferase II [Rhabdochlamydiaceae bacterium]|nr:lipopolysaccharide heptosyltransferase II [Rhabdochlamydiaceae bacterium]
MVDLLQFKPQNIIVRMPNWVGDMVMATPVLSDLRKAFPEAQLTAMCRSPISDLLQEDLAINELFSFTKTSRLVRRDEKKNILDRLRKGQYDLGIVLPNTFSSAWWFWQGDVKIRIGYDGAGRRALLSHPLEKPQNIDKQHLISTYKHLLTPLGLAVSDTKPRLYLKEKEVEQAKILLSQHGVKSHHKIVGINPGAAYGSAKCWLPERFREVTTRLLQDKDVIIVYFGDLITSNLVKEVCQGLSTRVVNMAGLTSLRELACLISLCNVLLTNDSGPMHIAGALNTPIVALFGSTSSIVTGPWQESTVIQKHVECAPCYRRTCPIDFRCMKQIEVQEVVQAIEVVLNKSSSPKKLHILS